MKWMASMRFSKTWMYFLPSLLGVLISSSGFRCYGQAPNYSFLTSGTEAPEKSYYDYIIIGGGTAGCPLAATLSQTAKVLILERGGSPYGNHKVTDLTSFMDNLCDQSPASAAQTFVSEDGVANQRARILGGGTGINAGFYGRASQDYVAKAGWDADLVKESYAWVERFLLQEPVIRQWQSAIRDGLVEAGVTPYNGFTYDHPHGTKTGGTLFDHNGHKRTAADLLLQANPDGLRVFLHSTAHKILFKHKGKQRPVAYGVAFKDTAGVMHTAYLKEEGPENEIIISAGALGSPQLLMLSGVGPAEHLKSLDIEMVMEQPEVGQGMADNPLNTIYIPSPSPVEIALTQIAGIARFGTIIESLCGVKYFACPSSEGSQSRQMSELEKKPVFQAGFIIEKVESPLSVGHLELRNTNPDDNPSVTFNYFKEPEDLQTCVEAVKTMGRVIQSEAFANFRYPNTSTEDLLYMTLDYLGKPQSGRQGSESLPLEEYCKKTVMTMWHYHGGCQVGRVVDHDYRVLGIHSLRVIDGSTFHGSPGTNPQATLMMLGRYMGVKIQSERLDKEREFDRRSGEL